MQEICSGLQFPEGPIAMPDGSVILVEIKRGTLSRVSPDGTIEVIADCGDGPNGAALGPDGRVYVCNNGGFTWGTVDGFTRPLSKPDDYRSGSIQAVDINSGKVETLYTECNGVSLKGPNDIVFDEHGGFYFTDLGKRTERTMDRGAVYYARPDGSSIREVVQPIETPNGIGLSPDNKILYVAETFSAKLRYWHIESPGVVTKSSEDPFHVGNILYGFTGYERLDSLAVDSQGNVAVATLGTGCITAITPRGKVRAVLPPPQHDMMVTNICFGGDDLRKAYITSSGLGRLYVTDWFCPGHKLNFAA
jgi:gluconolactonase